MLIPSANRPNVIEELGEEQTQTQGAKQGGAKAGTKLGVEIVYVSHVSEALAHHFGAEAVKALGGGRFGEAKL